MPSLLSHSSWYNAIKPNTSTATYWNLMAGTTANVPSVLREHLRPPHNILCKLWGTNPKSVFLSFSRAPSKPVIA